MLILLLLIVLFIFFYGKQETFTASSSFSDSNKPGEQIMTISPNGDISLMAASNIDNAINTTLQNAIIQEVIPRDATVLLNAKNYTYSKSGIDSKDENVLDEAKKIDKKLDGYVKIGSYYKLNTKHHGSRYLNWTGNSSYASVGNYSGNGIKWRLNKV